MEHCPVLENDAAVTERVAAAHRAYFGAERVSEMPLIGAASEDFGCFGLAGPESFAPPNIPYTFWSFGVTNLETWAQTPGDTPIEKVVHVSGPHSPFFAPDPEPALRTGIEAFAVAVLAYLGKA